MSLLTTDTDRLSSTGTDSGTGTGTDSELQLQALSCCDPGYAQLAISLCAACTQGPDGGLCLFKGFRLIPTGPSDIYRPCFASASPAPAATSFRPTERGAVSAMDAGMIRENISSSLHDILRLEAGVLSSESRDPMETLPAKTDYRKPKLNHQNATFLRNSRFPVYQLEHRPLERLLCDACTCSIFNAFFMCCLCGMCYCPDCILEKDQKEISACGTFVRGLSPADRALLASRKTAFKHHAKQDFIRVFKTPLDQFSSVCDSGESSSAFARLIPL